MACETCDLDAINFEEECACVTEEPVVCDCPDLNSKEEITAWICAYIDDHLLMLNQLNCCDPDYCQQMQRWILNQEVMVSCVLKNMASLL